MIDCFRQITAEPLDKHFDKVLVTGSNDNYYLFLEKCLRSFRLFHPDTAVVVFLFGPSPKCESLCFVLDCFVVQCELLKPPSVALAGVLHGSASRFVSAERYLVVDADVLFTGSVEPLFETLSCLDRSCILAYTADRGQPGVRLPLYPCYNVSSGDFIRLGFNPHNEPSFYINAGVLAGTKEALVALEGCIWDMGPFVEEIVDNKEQSGCSDEVVIALALQRAIPWEKQHRLSFVPLDRKYNYTPKLNEKYPEGTAILHFVGPEGKAAFYGGQF